MGFSMPRAVFEDRGLTLPEVMIVIAIIGIVAAIGGYYFKDVRERYQAESQVREMHVDIMTARSRALARNRIYFVTVSLVTGTNPSTYRITEDTNESGGTAPNAGDVDLFPSKILKYPVTAGAGTYILDTKGIIGTPAGVIFANAPKAIRFDTGDVSPEYDCIVIGPTRINGGKSNGGSCDPR